MRLKILLLGGTNTPGFVIERSCGEFQLEIFRPANNDVLVIDPPPHLSILTLSETNAFQDLDCLNRLRMQSMRIPVIAIAVRSSEALAIAAFRAGCRDFLHFPYTQDELAAAIQRCLFAGAIANKCLAPTTPEETGSLDRLIGGSQSMQVIRAYIAKIAPRASTVLITGETGTGKEVVAELLHQHGPTPHKPFISMNCAAIPESLVESELFGHEKGSFTGATHATEGKLLLAGDGTVFLDEVGDMSPYAQAKILRAIENRWAYRVGGRVSYAVRCRFIAASNRELEKSVVDGRFRKDLYYRLNVARIRLPSLRERKTDIPTLCQHFIAELNRDFEASVETCDQQLMTALIGYDWPGNVRELRNVLEAAFLNGPSPHLSLDDMPEWFVQGLHSSESPAPTERDRMIAALVATKWNKSRAAESLHWSRMTLYRKLSKYQIVHG